MGVYLKWAHSFLSSAFLTLLLSCTSNMWAAQSSKMLFDYLKYVGLKMLVLKITSCIFYKHLMTVTSFSSCCLVCGNLPRTYYIKNINIGRSLGHPLNSGRWTNQISWSKSIIFAPKAEHIRLKFHRNIVFQTCHVGILLLTQPVHFTYHEHNGGGS